jgi:hypothetical protein
MSAGTSASAVSRSVSSSKLSNLDGATSNPNTASSTRTVTPPSMGNLAPPVMMRRSSSYGGTSRATGVNGDASVNSRSTPRTEALASSNLLPLQSNIRARRPSDVAHTTQAYSSRTGLSSHRLRNHPTERNDEVRSSGQRLDPQDKLGASGHTRTASDSTGSTIKRNQHWAKLDARDPKSYAAATTDGTGAPKQAVSGDSTNHLKAARSSGSSAIATDIGSHPGSIVLCRPSEAAQLTPHLKALNALTPPSRAITPLDGSSSGTNSASCVLVPSDLLMPLSIILEVLVLERSLLRSGTTTIPLDILTLPPLASGKSLQLPECQGSSIDWSSLKIYIWSLGSIIDAILPYLQNHTAWQKKAVEDLTRGIRLYVGKIKKLFGEVARGYVDGYGFVKGWWDEKGMKGCAGEVGRWGDLFDA